MGRTSLVSNGLAFPFQKAADRYISIAPGDAMRLDNKHFKLVYFMEGGLITSFRGEQEFTLEKGDAISLSLPGEQIYRGVDPRKEALVDCFIITFAWPCAPSPESRRRHRGRGGKDFPALLRNRLEGFRHFPRALTMENLQLVKLALQEMESGAASTWRIVGLCMALVSGLLVEDGGSPSGIDIPTRGVSLVRHARQYLHENFRQPLKLGQIAWRAQISEEYLARLFKQHVGTTVFAYLNTLRVDRAKRLLLTTDWPVSRIAKECGYSSATLLGRHFKALAGNNPAAFRLLGRSQESFSPSIFVAAKTPKKRRPG